MPKSTSTDFPNNITQQKTGTRSNMSSASSVRTASAGSSWVADNKLTWLQRLAVNVIRCGPIPRHVAFIMDGNRRYATKVGMPSTTDGHRLGFDKLAEALQWCLELGIAEATVYAFSIENFKRSEEEVGTLMALAGDKFEQLLGELDRLHERGICIRVVGDWSLLPVALQRSMAEAVLRTSGNRRATLNVAFAYTSRDEATAAMRAIATEVRTGDAGDGDDGGLRPEDVTEELLRGCMYTRKSAEPDLLVRTSGESRLSDFMLFQVSGSGRTGSHNRLK